ncbi:MAG: MEDS domain-containing protein, partial [Myxococcales bacterium]
MQLYTSDTCFARVVGGYVDDALASGESAVVIATAPRWRLVRDHLTEAGVDVDDALRVGRLRTMDAEETLAALLEGGVPTRRAFEAVVAPVLDEARRASREPRVRAFGEMVNLLWARGQWGMAEVLEAHWNAAIRARRFTLLCAYQADVCGLDVPTGALEAALRAHNHVSVEARRRLAVRFDRAVDEVLGPAQAAMLQVVAAASHPPETYKKAPVELRVLDNGSDPATTAANLAEFAADPVVTAVVSGGCTACVAASAAEWDDAGVPVVGLAAGEEVAGPGGAGRFVFQLAPPTNVTADLLATELARA